MSACCIMIQFDQSLPTMGRIIRPTKVSFNPQASTTPSILHTLIRIFTLLFFKSSYLRANEMFSMNSNQTSNSQQTMKQSPFKWNPLNFFFLLFPYQIIEKPIVVWGFSSSSASSSNCGKIKISHVIIFS